MSQTIEVKTADLIGPALDWAAAMAEGGKSERPQDGQFSFDGVHYLCGPKRFEGSRFYSPSTDWSHGGPLIYKHRVLFDQAFGVFVATIPGVLPANSAGKTHLIAACRAIVAAKLGDTVQVPAELVTP